MIGRYINTFIIIIYYNSLFLYSIIIIIFHNDNLFLFFFHSTIHITSVIIIIFNNDHFFNSFILLLLFSCACLGQAFQNGVCIEKKLTHTVTPTINKDCLCLWPHDTFPIPNRSRSIANGSRPVNTEETGTLVPVSRDHLAIWNERVRTVHDWSRPVDFVVWTLDRVLALAIENLKFESLLKWLILITSACQSEINDMELGQYRSRSGRSVDMAKSLNGTRTVRGRSLVISCEHKPDSMVRFARFRFTTGTEYTDYDYVLQALTLDCGNHWPGGPVNQKIHWPPKKPTGPPKTCNEPNYFRGGNL